jgi:hypothetical protein
MGYHRKYKQLKLDIDDLSDEYPDVFLAFKLNGRTISGILQGSILDWSFHSDSSAFTRIVPDGVLRKYMLWLGPVPRGIHKLFDQLIAAAAKSGFELEEKEQEEMA